MNNRKQTYMKRTNDIGILLLLAFFAGFILDVFYIKRPESYIDLNPDIRLFSLLILWLVIVRFSRFTSIATFKLTLIFLIILSVFFVFFRDNAAVERLASWVYIYLLTGVIQQLFESQRRKKVKKN